MSCQNQSPKKIALKRVNVNMKVDVRTVSKFRFWKVNNKECY